MNLVLSKNAIPPWHSVQNLHTRGYCFLPDGQLLAGLAFAQYISQHIDTFFLPQNIACLSGQWCIVVQCQSEIKVISDITRTYPIFFHTQLQIVSDEFGTLSPAEVPIQVSPLSAEMYSVLGYTLDWYTLHSYIVQVPPASIASISADGLKHETYFVLETTPAKPDQDRETELTEILMHMGRQMVKFLNGRQAVVPLSGGFDSRLLALLLHIQNYKHVVTFTYGHPEHAEVSVSREIASRLGYEWHFVDYSQSDINQVFHTPQFLAYLHHMSEGTSMPYLQEYFAVKYLKEHDLVKADAVFIPGHSGDTFAGSHFYQENEASYKLNNIADYILQNNQLTNIGAKLLAGYVHDFVNQKYECAPWRKVYYWDSFERQCNFIVPSTRVFSFFGYQYFLPFWNTQLVRHFCTYTYAQLYRKKIYNKVLRQSFFGPAGILFPSDTDISVDALNRKARMMSIKRYLPDFVLSHKKKKTDWMLYRKFTAPMLADLKKMKGSCTHFYLTYNVIISKWFLYLKTGKLYKS